MIDKLMYLETSTDKYPMIFSLNVIEAIQEEYGSYNKWVQMMDEEEPNIKALKFGLIEAINEGIDIKNQFSEVKMDFVDSKKVGRIITEIGLNKASGVLMQSLTASSTVEDTEKNIIPTRSL